MLGRRMGVGAGCPVDSIRIDLTPSKIAALEEQSPYLIMSQSHPRRQIIRNSQDIPQCIDLKLIE